LVIVGDKAGSKADKALSLGVRTTDVQGFHDLLNGKYESVLPG
jgi:NAD-dependent DNA ligase